MPRYITIVDVRKTDPDYPPGYPDWSDDDITEMIDRHEGFIDFHTGQFFNEQALILKVDGQGGRILHLNIPIIELTKLQINDSGQDEDIVNDVIVYDGRGFPSDDRRNPKITLTAGKRSIFAGAVNPRRIFLRGYRNQYLEGKFGFVEPDGSVPLRIQRAVLRLVVREIDAGGLSPEPEPPGYIVKEVTDGHSITYGTHGGGDVAETTSLTGDAEIDQVIADYRVPAKIGVTRVAQDYEY